MTAKTRAMQQKRSNFLDNYFQKNSERLFIWYGMILLGDLEINIGGEKILKIFTKLDPPYCIALVVAVILSLIYQESIEYLYSHKNHKDDTFSRKYEKFGFSRFDCFLLFTINLFGAPEFSNRREHQHKIYIF